MLAGFFHDFSQIPADAISDGVLPKDRRQVAGTAVTTSSSSPSSSPSSPSPTTMSSSSDETTSNSTPSSTPITSTSPTPTQGTSSASPLTTSDSADSSVIRTTVPVTTTDSSGSVGTSGVVTSATVTKSASSSKTTASSEFVVVGSSTIDRSTLSSDITVTSALVASQTVHTTFTSVFTRDGQVYTSAISTDEVVATTTGFATSTISPSLQDNGSSGNSLSSSDKSIIGGVVGGIGGAILLGGLGLVAWRLWGKKKRQRLPQDDYLGSAHDSIAKESRDSTTGLERYQQPHVSGPVNTASNF